MKNRSYLLLFVAMLVLTVAQAYAAQGVVVYRHSGCDYFVVQTKQGYDLLEWYGGWDPDKGDVLIGKFEEYGMHDIQDDTADEKLTVWVEEYWLSRTDALEQLLEQCE